MATAVERKFTGIRKRLDQLGYRQPLGVESLPLVERLVADLLHTTDSLKTCKQQVAKNKEQKGLWQQHVQPYRHDNARLTQENLEMHQKLMKMKETSESRNKDLKIALRRLEHENTDLKFLNTQYMQKLLTKEKESQAKTERILQLQEKSSQAVVHTPGGRKKQIAFRRQRMDIDTTVPPTDFSPSVSKEALPTPPQPYVADLLKVADDNITKLRDEVTVREKEKMRLTESIEDLKRQVDRREKEIERLSSQLKGGRPPEALALEGQQDGNERMVAHLNIQVDFLQKANMELEKQLEEERNGTDNLKDRITELSDKNSHICAELKDIGELVKEMEKDRKAGELKLKEEVSNWRDKVQELKDELRSKEDEMNKRVKGYDELLKDNRQMANLLATSQIESDNAANMIETLSEDNRVMKKQIYHLKESERNLKDRVFKAEAASRSMPRGGMAKAHLESHNELVKERDELKEAVKEIEIQMIQIQEEARSLTQDRDNFKLLYEQVIEDLNIMKADPRGSLPHSGFQSQRVKAERDDARLEAQQLRLECESLRGRLKLAKEGRELVEEKEMEINIELTQKLEEISEERDCLRKRLDTLQQLNQQLEEELDSSKTTVTEAMEEIRELKRKVHTLQGLVDAGDRRNTEHLRGLQEQIAHSESSQGEIVRLRSIVHQLEEELKDSKAAEVTVTGSLQQLDQEHNELRIECDKKDREIYELKTSKEELFKETSELKLGLTKLSSSESNSQVQLQSKDNEIASIRQRLSVKESETQRLQVGTEELDRQVNQLKDNLATMTHENQAVHGDLRKIMEERDGLRERLEEHERNAIKYEEMLSAKEQDRVELMESYKALSEEVDRLDNTVKYTREMESSSQMELDSVQKERQHLQELCQQQATEIEQHINTLHSYEVQLSNLTNAMSRMEQTIRQEQEEKKALLIDLSSVRELCVQIEKTKESLTRQLASQSISHEQTCADMADVTAERDLLKQQLATEQVKSDNLETLLTRQRRKEFQTEVTDKERGSEIQHLKQQISRLETDNISHKDQVRKLRGDINVKAEELERLKAELSAEKFQKKHIQEQVNKLRSAVGGASSHRVTPSPSHSPPVDLSPPTTKQPLLDEAIERSKENLSSESARLVDQLISSSSTST